MTEKMKKMEKKTFPDLRVFHHFPGKTSEQRKSSTPILINVSISNDERGLQKHVSKK